MSSEKTDEPSKFRQIFESSRDAIMLIGPEGYIDCNEATLQLFNVETKDKFKRLTPWELSPSTQPDGSDSKKVAREHIDRALNEGEDFFEWIHQRSDGEIFPAEVKLSSFKLEGRKLVQALVRDITERKQREQKLRAAEQQLRAEVEERKQFQEKLEQRSAELQVVIDAMPDACFVFDKEGNYCRVMTSQEELLAAPPEELLNSDIEEQLPPELAKKCLAAIRRALETGEVQRIEYTLCVPSKERDFSARISPLAGDRVVFVARDISKQKEKERELEEIQNHLTELVKKRTEKIEKKNLALEEMIDRLERRVRKTHNKLYEKFDKNVISVLNRMIPELDSEQVERVEAIKQKIKKILKPDENIPVTSGLFEKLTNRELEIADYVRDGFSTKEIAKMIGRSSNTVRNQRASIRKKLGLKNTGESLKNFLKEYM